MSLISDSLRRRLQRKERKLQPLVGYRYYIASEDVDITRLLDWFFRVKPQRMAQQLPSVFAEADVQEFIRGACMTKLADGSRAIEIHALERDEEVIAIFAGVADDHRFSTMFNTYTLSRKEKFSPGLTLMRHVIHHLYDYKLLVCPDYEPIFDSFIPLSVRGRFAVGAQMMKPAEAERVTGFKVGGISPFGQRRPVKTVIEQSALAHEEFYVNGGQRGLQVRLSQSDVRDTLKAVATDVIA
ncbi:CelD/BcsL family acetyltransferase involved in cellulose biosynthesis [Bradyrhizobium ottawaense]